MASEQGQGSQSHKLTDEERAVLKECESESFFRREEEEEEEVHDRNALRFLCDDLMCPRHGKDEALPLSLGAMAGVQFLVRTGKAARHPKYGALPKSIIAGGLAYLAGKVSYLQECRRKILEKIPESNLAMQVRKGQSPTQPDMSNRQDMYSKQVPASDHEDDSKSTGLAYPADPRSLDGLNDSQRPSMDNEVKQPDAPEEKRKITYDELRQRNREDYKNKLSKAPSQPEPGTPSYKDSPFMPQKAWPDKNPPPTQEPSSTDDPSFQAPPKRKRTNMWGDVIDD